MSTAFDTLKLADRLQTAGFTAEQARGTASALSEALTSDLATKNDLAEVRRELKTELAEVRAELLVMKWMIGFVLALQAAIFIKLFVH